MTRTAVITGGASGLGEACARRFAAEGARVWILDANAARAAEVAADIGGGARS
ncbi:MAG: SDR family NAD(P)-dependent oxidoreductase, partial [Rhodobacteraceae bacterium]|nr:SDR family NAD(P)-dependent oxidoreductase [Paracoccaceae bacterium]